MRAEGWQGKSWEWGESRQNFRLSGSGLAHGGLTKYMSNICNIAPVFSYHSETCYLNEYKYVSVISAGGQFLS